MDRIWLGQLSVGATALYFQLPASAFASIPESGHLGLDHHAQLDTNLLSGPQLQRNRLYGDGSRRRWFRIVLL
jgi:hypothetical protein